MTWPTPPLSEVAEVRLGRQRAPKNHQGDSMRPYIRAANVTWSGLDLSDVKSMNFTDAEMSIYRMEPGDIVLSEASGSAGEVGKPALWSGEIEDCAFQNTLIRVRPHEHEPKFLLHYFRYQALAGRFVEHSRGVGIHHLGRARLATWPTPVPPLEVQRRIVDILEDHLSRIDAADSGIRVNRIRLDVLRQSVIDEAFQEITDPDAKAFRDTLFRRREHDSVKTPAPADLDLFHDAPPWPVASLEEVTDPTRVIRYGILKPASESGDVPYVEVRDLRSPVLDRDALKRTSAALDQQFAGARLRGGDVVVAVRGSFERSAVVPEALIGANVSRDVARLAPLAGMNPSFVHHWHQTSLSKRYLRRHARGVAVRGVNVGTLRAMPIPVVSPAAQADVVAEIEGRLESLDRLGAALDRVQRHARVLKRALLAAAFDGSLLTTAEDRAESSEVANV